MEKDGVVARKKNFIATVRNRVARTPGIVAQNDGPTSAIMHVGKISPQTGVVVVAKDSSATLAKTHVSK